MNKANTRHKKAFSHKTMNKTKGRVGGLCPHTTGRLQKPHRAFRLEIVSGKTAK